MAGQSQFGVVKEEFGVVREDFAGFTTVSEFVASLKSAVQSAEGLVFAEDILKMKIEGKKIENELLQEKLQVEESEKLRLEKECGDLKELASRLREERDVLHDRLKENEDYIAELKRKNCELECQKPRAETDVDIYQSRIKELEGKIESLEKDASVTAETRGEDRVVIIDSDDEYASHESASDMEIEKDASVNLTTTETNAGRRSVSEERSDSQSGRRVSEERSDSQSGNLISPDSTTGAANFPATSSRYENQKRRDWNTFCRYLRDHRPPLSFSMCSGANVVEFLRHLDQFGKTKVHNQTCPFFGLPSPPAPCSCPLQQAWGSLDSLSGRLRAAYEEHSGSPKGNPFGARAVGTFLKEVRDFQAKARGFSYDKKRKRPKSSIH